MCTEHEQSTDSWASRWQQDGLLESTATKGDRAGLFPFDSSRTANVNKGRAESARKNTFWSIKRNNWWKGKFDLQSEH